MANPHPLPAGPRALTPHERRRLRDLFAMRALPFCCMHAEREDSEGGDGASKGTKAKWAAEHAYIIADAMLAVRGLPS